MSTMSDAAISAKRLPPEVKPMERCLDILIVFAVSAIAFFLENLAIDAGWIPLASEVRGAISVLAGASAAVWVVLARGGTLADLGFRRPERWTIVPLQVFLVLIAFIAMQILAPLLVSSIISLPEPDLSRYDSITGNLGGAVLMALVLPLTASIPEEIIYRGFLIGRLSDIFGWNFSGVLISVFNQAIIFGAIHFQWGIGGMIVTFMMGLVWGAAYLLCGRNLWVVILAHSTGHILFVLQLYLGNSIVL